MERVENVNSTQESILQECATKSYVDDLVSSNYDLERRVEKLENFLQKIMPLLPDEIKLYLEVTDD